MVSPMSWAFARAQRPSGAPHNNAVSVLTFFDEIAAGLVRCDIIFPC